MNCPNGCTDTCKNLENIQFKRAKGFVPVLSDLSCALMEIDNLNEQIKLLHLERAAGGTEKTVRNNKPGRPKKDGVREGLSLRAPRSTSETPTPEEE